MKVLPILFFLIPFVFFACSSSDSEDYYEPESREKIYTECMEQVENNYTCNGCGPDYEPKQRQYADSVFASFDCREKEWSCLIEACMYIQLQWWK